MGRGSESGGQYRFSQINAGETEVRFNAIFNFLKDYRPEAKKTRTLVNGMLRLGMRFLNAPACRRQLRFEVADQQAKYWSSRVPKEEQDCIQTADAMLKNWGAADLMQRDIRHRRLLHGLASVDGERPRFLYRHPQKGRLRTGGNPTAHAGPMSISRLGWNSTGYSGSWPRTGRRGTSRPTSAA